jgi:aspartyl-tRNA(Asn)/glutamyl-tRNA(Gln) amidotransferase subunit A
LFSFSTIKNYHHQIISKTISCVDTVKYYLATIQQKQHLNAFVEVFDDVIKRAEELDKLQKEGKELGKLHGVIVSIKDVICYKGHKVSASSKVLENYTSVYNATAVEKLLAAGAIIIGRNNLDTSALACKYNFIVLNRK